MTRDEIIRMAREAGFGPAVAWKECTPPFERFAALVAAAERINMKIDGWRQCAKGQRTTQFCGQLEVAVAAEREAIKAIIHEHDCKDGVLATDDVLAAIRARGEK